ncbi:MAG: class II fructose-1,6-bisphosphate aldolase [bacterium]
MLVNLNQILLQAKKLNYAVGHFNTSNLEITRAIINTAWVMKSPVIIGVSEKAIKYAGLLQLSNIVRSLSKEISIPIVLHLDHGANFELVQECIASGFTSVMIDGSHLPLNDNIKLTKKVVSYAHKKNVSVEAEIGRLAGIEDNLKSSSGMFTDPKQARVFVKETDCDALAIAIGTSHGAYKFKGKPKLRIDILKQIAYEVKIPLVLHGASGVKTKWVNYLNRFGGKIEHTQGVPDTLIRSAIINGISKINVDTDIRIAFTAGIREYLSKNPQVFDPRKILSHAMGIVSKVIEQRIRLFGSAGRA